MSKKEELLTVINEAPYFRVVFTKKDGTVRSMRATKNFDHIPEDHHPKGDNVVENDEVIRVFDLEKVGWRSFRVDSVISLYSAEESNT